MNNKNTIQFSKLLPEIEGFLNNLIIEAGLEKTDPALKAMMINDLSERLNSQLVLTLAQNFNENQLNTFSRLASVDEAQAAAFLKQEKPNIMEIFKQALEEFKAVFLEQKKS